ncbi:MAG: hypothetical protein ACH350_04080 [Parachlamydiaceae bacterium]
MVEKFENEESNNRDFLNQMGFGKRSTVSIPQEMCLSSTFKAIKIYFAPRITYFTLSLLAKFPLILYSAAEDIKRFNKGLLCHMTFIQDLNSL